MSDDILVDGLKNGSEEAFEELYNRHAESLLRHLYTLMKNTEIAEELLHESMMLMLKKINFYSPNTELKNSFKSWLFRLATNRAIDELRKNKGPMSEVEEEILPDGNEDIESQYEKKEQENIISELLLELPLIQRTMLSLRVHEDLSYTEISAICSRDINTVKQGLFQARKSIKNLMLSHGEIL